MSSIDTRSSTGWTTFAAIWLVIAGSFNVVEELALILPIFLLLLFGIVQLAAGFMVFSGNPTGTVLGVSVASVAIFIWFFFLFAAPWGALMALIINSIVIYGLTIGREP